jgi:hypothetical protein
MAAKFQAHATGFGILIRSLKKDMDVDLYEIGL